MKTIHEASTALKENRATPQDLVEQCLANIDRWESRVKAWVFVDAEGARAEARRLGDELKRGPRRSPLHGIPFAIKDIFDVHDWPTAAGSKLWAQAIARNDADVVRRLRDAGAIFLGKTVTTAYASFDPPVTRNPWNLQRTPGGSSSGSAAALATGMTIGAIGSQTGGSITRPASYCGVAGLKPTYGLLSCAGVMALAPSMDHPGPMSRCVRDLALTLEVMGGVASFDTLLAGEVRTPRLVRVRGLFEELAEPPMRKMMDEVQKALNQSLPAPMAEVALPAGFGEVIANHRVIMAVEAAAYHRVRLARHPDDYPPRIKELMGEGAACPAPEYARCLENQRRLKADMRAVVKDHILVMPATTGAAPDAGTTGNPAFNSPWSFTGLPALSFPTGHFADGLPLCLQLVAGENKEAELIEAGLWCEKVLGVMPLEATP